MHLLLILLLAAPEQPQPHEREVTTALLSLNNYVDSVSFADACHHNGGMTALRPLEARIDHARRRAVAAFPAMSGTEGAGDTDFVCRRTGRPVHTPGRMIRQDVERLLDQLEAALPPTGGQ